MDPHTPAKDGDNFLYTVAKSASAYSKLNSKDAIRRARAAPRPVGGGSRYGKGTEDRLHSIFRGQERGDSSL